MADTINVFYKGQVNEGTTTLVSTGAKNKAVLKSLRIFKKQTNENCSFALKFNGTTLWSGSPSNGQTVEFDFDKMFLGSNEEITVDVGVTPKYTPVVTLPSLIRTIIIPSSVVDFYKSASSTLSLNYLVIETYIFVVYQTATNKFGIFRYNLTADTVDTNFVSTVNYNDSYKPDTYIIHENKLHLVHNSGDSYSINVSINGYNTQTPSFDETNTLAPFLTKIGNNSKLVQYKNTVENKLIYVYAYNTTVNSQGVSYLRCAMVDLDTLEVSDIVGNTQIQNNTANSNMFYYKNYIFVHPRTMAVHISKVNLPEPSSSPAFLISTAPNFATTSTSSVYFYSYIDKVTYLNQSKFKIKNLTADFTDGIFGYAYEIINSVYYPFMFKLNEAGTSIVLSQVYLKEFVGNADQTPIMWSSQTGRVCIKPSGENNYIEYDSNGSFIGSFPYTSHQEVSNGDFVSFSVASTSIAALDRDTANNKKYTVSKIKASPFESINIEENYISAQRTGGELIPYNYPDGIYEARIDGILEEN